MMDWSLRADIVSPYHAYVCVMPMHRDDMNECAERYGECCLLKTAINTSCLTSRAFQVSHKQLFDRRV